MGYFMTLPVYDVCSYLIISIRYHEWENILLYKLSQIWKI